MAVLYDLLWRNPDPRIWNLHIELLFLEPLCEQSLLYVEAGFPLLKEHIEYRRRHDRTQFLFDRSWPRPRTSPREAWGAERTVLTCSNP